MSDKQSRRGKPVKASFWARMFESARKRALKVQWPLVMKQSSSGTTLGMDDTRTGPFWASIYNVSTDVYWREVEPVAGGGFRNIPDARTGVNNAYIVTNTGLPYGKHVWMVPGYLGNPNDYRYEYHRRKLPCDRALCITIKTCDLKPLPPGATIHITGPGGFDTTLTADSNGKACTSVPSEGIYNVVVSDVPGYHDSDECRPGNGTGPIPVTVACGITNYTVRLSPLLVDMCVYVYACQYYDFGDGTGPPQVVGPPLKNASVTVSGGASGSGTTDADGKCCFQFDMCGKGSPPIFDVPITFTASGGELPNGETAIGYQPTSTTLTYNTVLCALSGINAIVMQPAEGRMCCPCCNGHTVSKTLTVTNSRGTFTLSSEPSACTQYMQLKCGTFIENWGGECVWTGCHVYTESEAACPDPSDYAWHCCKKASCQVTVRYALMCSPYGTSGEYLTKPQWRLERQFVMCTYNQAPGVCPDYRASGRLKCDSCITIYDSLLWSCLVGDESSECEQGILDATFNPATELIPWPPELMGMITVTGM